MNNPSFFLQVVYAALTYTLLCWCSIQGAPVFKPIASGDWAQVNAKDGDSAFNADYFSNPRLEGPPFISRLEDHIGRDGPAIPGLSSMHSVRWSATLTPAISGVFPISLQSVGAASLAIDGKVLLSRPGASADFRERLLGKVELRASKPYEIVIELRDADSKSRIAAEWAEPEALGTEIRHDVPIEEMEGPPPGIAIGPVATLRNAGYSVALNKNGSFELSENASGLGANFEPEFVVVWQTPGSESELDPKGGKYQDDKLGWMNLVVPSWEKETDFFVVAHPRTRLRAVAASVEGRSVRWSFPPHPGYEIAAELRLPEDGSEPAITAHFKARSPGQFAFGYTGAPAASPDSANWVWQPLIWQDKRFPNRSYLTKEFQCPIPWAMIGIHNLAVGVGADASEMPYRMPTLADSRFGVLVRNAAGEMQPMVFAPVLGGPESKVTPGDHFTFVFRITARKSGWYDTYKHLARLLYGFSDVRENSECSLNTTIENMLDYILTDRFSYWYPRFKTWGYQNDGGPGAGRQQSAADAIGLALVCDSRALYERRSLPTLEYVLSRKSLSTRMDQQDFMGGPVKNASDLVAAYRLTGKRSAVIRKLFERTSTEDEGTAKRLGTNSSITLARTRMLDDLIQYRLTGKRAFLGQACAAADRYVELRVDRPALDFRDAGSSFWHELTPAWDVLYELYNETGREAYCRAAVLGIQKFTGYTYLVPAIPDALFTANPGGIYNGQQVPEETVPAWRVSANGLTAECGGTAHSHRGVYMAPYASYMARLARDANDTFLRDIARNAVVGRYANYPSYAYRNGYSTIHQKADYPLRSFEEIKKFTTAHYNHPLPMAAFLIDYLISDIYARSDGKIDFPSEYTSTGAFFRNKVYGFGRGHFYDQTNIVPWLPKGLAKLGNTQVNYLAGRGTDNLCLALANQSPRPITTTITLNPKWVKLAPDCTAKVWVDNKPAKSVRFLNGSATLNLSPKGLACLVIPDVTAISEFQQAVLDPTSPPLPLGSTISCATRFGDITATALRFGKGLTTVHVWLKPKPSQIKSARLIWLVKGEPRSAVCSEFPFEFTIPISDSETEFVCKMEATATGGGIIQSSEIKLSLR